VVPSYTWDMGSNPMPQNGMKSPNECTSAWSLTSGPLLNTVCITQCCMSFHVLSPALYTALLHWRLWVIPVQFWVSACTFLFLRRLGWLLTSWLEAPQSFSKQYFPPVTLNVFKKSISLSLVLGSSQLPLRSGTLLILFTMTSQHTAGNSQLLTNWI
jgi:hypothetical protein